MYIPNLNFTNLSMTRRQWLFVFIGFYQNNHSDLVLTKILFFSLSFFLLLLFIVSIPACFSKKLSFTCIFGSVASDLSGAAKFLYTSSTLKHWLYYLLAATMDCSCSKILNHGLYRGLFLSVFKVLGWKIQGQIQECYFVLRFQDFTWCKN